MAKVGVVGTTSWGTTLSLILAQKGIDVYLWARTEEEAATLRRDGENKRLLPGLPFPSALQVTVSAAEAFGGVDAVFVAVPSRSFRDNLRAFIPHIRQPASLISATKGLEFDTGKRMSQVMEEELPEELCPSVAVLSGPNLAREIAQGKPSSSVIACKNAQVSQAAQELLTSERFRVYTNEDVVGVELGGSLKNIIALGAGICDGLTYGDNAKAAFMTRGLAEITRLGVAAGANPLTFAGLAGLGDLVATCSSPLSRNHYVGEQLAQGRKLDEIRSTMKNVAEGVDTTVAALKMARGLGVEMPIAEATYKVLFEGIDVRQAASELMGRAPRSELPDMRLNQG